MVLIKSFKDHFSDKSADYSTYRPRYPAELLAYLAQISPATNLAWDCATGSGQAAIALAEYFSQVIATDASENQIRHATAHERVSYKTEPAEHTSIAAASVDLITVAQALHWFDLDRFTVEVMRVLKPGGILAVWTYGLLSIAPSLDVVIAELYGSTLEDYWPPERKLVEAGYQHIDMPLTPLPSPDFQMHTHWDLSQLIGYLSTWSAVRKYQQQDGSNPIEMIYPQLSSLWGEPTQQRLVQWPLTLKVWKHA